MAAPSVVFSVEGVRAFLIGKGGKVSNAELAKQFRNYLLDPKEQEKNKALFKEFISAVGSIKREGNDKFVVLKPEHEKSATTSKDVSSSASTETARVNIENNKHGSESVRETEFIEANDQFIGIPVAPPRRKHQDQDEDRKSFSSKEHSEDNSQDSQSSNSNDEKTVDAQVISVKERAQKLNRMASETQLVLTSNTPNKRRERNDKIPDDDDVSLIVLNSQTKEWIVKAASSDFAALSKLLKEDSRLARYKTALHWAAKHGKIEVVKLIASTSGASVNIRSGFTPLHLAAQFKRCEVYELLINGYNANTKIRDYSGRTAEDYIKTPAHRREQELPRNYVAQKETKRDVVVSKDPGFLRLGSFNVKVRKTAESISKSKSKIHKTWGSADSLPENADELMMPPPNTIPWPKHLKQRKSCTAFRSGGTQC